MSAPLRSHGPVVGIGPETMAETALRVARPTSFAERVGKALDALGLDTGHGYTESEVLERLRLLQARMPSMEAPLQWSGPKPKKPNKHRGKFDAWIGWHAA